MENIVKSDENNEYLSISETKVNHNQEINIKIEEKKEKPDCSDNSEEIIILDYVKYSPAIFRSQQMEEAELSSEDKKKIAENLLHKNPVNFLNKFGKYLKEEHLNFFLNKYGASYEVKYYVKNLKILLNDHNRKIIKKNRRYEAMKRMEAEGNYFSEVEMEKREPLLYHQMVGQYLSEKEKILKNRQAQKNVIPTFSNFLIDRLEREEINELIKSQQKEEQCLGQEESSEDECTELKNHKRWGEDWEENNKTKQNNHKKQRIHLSIKEKNLLLEEFKSIMQNNFLNGKDNNFNYSEVDFNDDYDSIELRAQDEEEKYFEEETYDNSVCTDTGVEDY